MNQPVVVIGGGITGLTIAYRLSQKGVPVTILERSPYLGGLAAGFKQPEWDWHLEHHYHHIFQSDTSIQKLATEVGAPYFFTNPKTALLYQDNIYKFDGPAEILTYPHLNSISKLRLSAAIAFLKLWPRHQDLHQSYAQDWIRRYMGEEVWQKIWQPLFVGKFGEYSQDISTVWFWARIHARTQALGYFEGGFQNLVNQLSLAITQAGGEIQTSAEVNLVSQSNATYTIHLPQKKIKAKHVILAAPSSVATKLFPQALPDDLPTLEGLGAVTILLALKQQFFKDNTYWLNINQKAPFLALVEHTNFVSSKHYNNQHLLYIGNYLPTSHPYFKSSVVQLIDKFTPTLQKINPHFKKTDIQNSWVFKAPFAQPIITPGYQPPSSFKTKLPNLWWISMQHVYPWDRGTNYAVEWGNKLAGQFIKTYPN